MINKEKTVFALFNISLCLLAANKPHDAAACLEEAASLCRKDIYALTETSDFVSRALEASEAASDGYKAPMPAIISEKYARAAKIKIIRVLADAYLRSKNFQKLQEIASNPDYVKYKNIKEALYASNNNG